MSQRNRFSDAALGVIVGVGIALLFLVWAFPGFRDPAYQQDRYQHAKNSETGKDNPVVRPSLWETYTSPTDTYAQWIAAFSALFSVGVSIWAVRLVRDTLAINRRATVAAEAAVAETARIGEAQIRAYISVTKVEVRISGGFDFVHPITNERKRRPYRIGIFLTAGNGGQTPARRIRTAVVVQRPIEGDLEIVGGEFRLIQNIDITPGQTDYVIYDDDFEIPEEIGRRFCNREIDLVLKGHVVYDPVAGPQRRETPFAYLLNYTADNFDPNVEVRASAYVEQAT
ncbi:hypothetical protein RFM99_16740 [Mesorhizobium sp. VK4C]|nr:hypothetical protein [Mesorhizobium sp. VK4C]MDX8500056.1 hypothetical protein [Mesorhizobium sp. VK4C]